jgi:hypothetical protein
LDYDVITETTSIDQALCIIISLYVLFELQFGLHNRIIHLLYGVLLQEPAILTKQLRSSLKQWNIHIDKKESKNTQTVTTTSTNNITSTTPMENLIQVEDTRSSSLDNEEQEAFVDKSPDLHSPHEEQEDFTEKSPVLHSPHEERDELSIFTLLSDTQNQTTSYKYAINKEQMEGYSKDTSESSTSSSPTGPPLVIYIPFPEEQQVTKSPSPTPVLKKNTRTVNIEQKILTKSSQPSSTVSKTNISAIRKRRGSPIEPIASRLKRSRNKKTN